MLIIKYNNPDGEAFPNLANFRSSLTNYISDFGQQQKEFKAREPKLTFKPDGMGEPITIIFLFGLLVKYKGEVIAVAAIIKLIKNIRDLYVSFKSDHKSEKGDNKSTDSVEINIEQKVIQLPATDQEIEEFINENVESLVKKK